jgi:hypothetical protein
MSVSQASEQRNISEISATDKTGFLRTSDSLRCIDGGMFGPAMVASGLETLMCASRDRRSRVSIRSDSCHSIVTRDSLARLPLWNGVAFTLQLPGVSGLYGVRDAPRNPNEWSSLLIAVAPW